MREMTIAEVAEILGKDTKVINRKFHRHKDKFIVAGAARQSGKTWLLNEEGLRMLEIDNRSLRYK